MLHELLETLSDDDTRIEVTVTIRSVPGDGVIDAVTAEALRTDGRWQTSQAGFLEGHLINLRRHRTAVLHAIDAVSAEPESLAAVGYRHREPAASHLLCIDTVQVDPAERGRGLGLILAGAALAHLSSARQLTAILHPHPLAAGGELEPGELAAACRALARYWSRVGFAQAPGASGYLILHTTDFDPAQPPQA
ncbi:hypothetical protein D477_000625 [Arthrobacter crystallopoietes BAB-32]|uniref:N-acetyltransferase domain-containing protein n=1 Tax=Arthrobacter crystallopoietes BAB-32 TaxID=1246476 RepID=N1V7Q1_9MICC|nr:hypothetical protein [Arthrobacter crystallopoietes]EMY36142.1 hypothetical protein D477_000625 [Arthrobacter crystallopoietes BAB-32]